MNDALAMYSAKRKGNFAHDSKCTLPLDHIRRQHDLAKAATRKEF